MIDYRKHAEIVSIEEPIHDEIHALALVRSGCGWNYHPGSANPLLGSFGEDLQAVKLVQAVNSLLIAVVVGRAVLSHKIAGTPDANLEADCQSGDR